MLVIPDNWCFLLTTKFSPLQSLSLFRVRWVHALSHCAKKPLESSYNMKSIWQVLIWVFFFFWHSFGNFLANVWVTVEKTEAYLMFIRVQSICNPKSVKLSQRSCVPSKTEQPGGRWSEILVVLCFWSGDRTIFDNMKRMILYCLHYFSLNTFHKFDSERKTCVLHPL